MLEDVKIALEWAANNLRRAEGSAKTFPEKYTEAKDLYERTFKKYNELVEEWIKNNCP